MCYICMCKYVYSEMRGKGKLRCFAWRKQAVYWPTLVSFGDILQNA